MKMKFQIACVKLFTNDSRMADRMRGLFVQTFGSLESAAKAVADALGWVNYCLATWVPLRDQHTCAVYANEAERDQGLPPVARITVEPPN